MKKHLLILVLLCLNYAAVFGQTNHGDSAWYEGRYRSQEEMRAIRKKEEKETFETWFMPGLAYSMYQPKQKDSTGTFSGLTVEYLIYAKVDQNDDPGPSHVRVYTKLNILNSDRKSINSMFMYTIGLDLSLEKNPKRQFMIPYFGLEMGGISQKQFGTSVQFTPTFGLHLLSKKNMFINVHGGYIYPIKNFEMLQGWYGQVGMNFALW